MVHAGWKPEQTFPAMMMIDLGSLNGTIYVKCIGVNAVASIYWLPVEERGLNYDELSQVSDQSEI